MTPPTAHERRQLLAVLLRDEPVPDLTAADEGRVMLRRLLTDPTRKVYRTLALPWPKEPERLVHESRVSSRRLVEALTLVGPAVGKARARKLARRARRLRRALGATRQAHVMIDDLRRLARRASLSDEATQGLDVMQASGSAALENASEAYPPERLLRHGIDILEAADHPRKDLALPELASAHLFRRAGEVKGLLGSMADPALVADHHRLRIRFKSLRYTVEILEGPFSEAVDTRRVVLQAKALQDALGVLNDAQDLLRWLGRRRVARHLEPRILEGLRTAVREEQETRFKIAQEAVHEVGHKLAMRLQRAAGRIGPL